MADRDMTRFFLIIGASLAVRVKDLNESTENLITVRKYDTFMHWWNLQSSSINNKELIKSRLKGRNKKYGKKSS